MSFVARNMFLSIKDLLKRENELASEMSLLKELKRFRHWKIKNKQKKTYARVFLTTLFKRVNALMSIFNSPGQLLSV